MRLLHRSWLFRVLAFLMLMVGAMSAAIFLSIDRFVSLQFSAIAQERLNYQADELRRLIERELKGLASIAELAAADSDLRHSAQYHLLLEGENKPLLGDLERIRSTFSIGAMTLWEPDGRWVAGSTADPVGRLVRTNQSAAAKPPVVESSTLWLNGDLWLVATAGLVSGSELLAVLQLARPLSPILDVARIFGSEAQVGLVGAGSPQTEGTIRVPVQRLEQGDTMLELTVRDPVLAALEQTKKVVGTTLLSGTVILSLIIIVWLRRQLRPMQELTRIAPEVARGLEQGHVPRVQEEGHAEVAQLVRAFNAMLDDLLRLRSLEEEVRHNERFSTIGRMATRVAHDINNPLTVIKNTAILLRKERGGERELAQDLERIIHHSQRCSRITDNLLRFGRPLKLQLETLEMDRFLEAYLADLTRRRVQTPYRLAVMGAGLRFRGDRCQIEQMLDNLFNNAYEANGGNAVDIEVGISDDYDVFIRIRDNGTGFQDGADGRIFELFYTTKPEGTGLGLPNADAIARAHGGSIRITGPESGEVTVFLPGEAAPVSGGAP